MRRDEAVGLGRMVGVGLRTATMRVQDIHAGVERHVYAGLGLALGPAVRPIRDAHSVIRTGVYTAVAGGLDLASQAGGWVGAAVVDDERSVTAHPRAHGVLAVVNGFHGHLLHEARSPLAFDLVLRHAHHDLAITRDALRAAYPDATGRLAVYVHGLVETELSWERRSERAHGESGVSYGSLLRRDLGYTPVWVRYNTGLRISANGRRLADVLADLVAQWPVPVEEIALVGHSMGGLVLHSALVQAAGSAGSPAWLDLVRHTVTIGSPMAGARLERAVTHLTRHLDPVADARWLVATLRERSVGIKDLRHGNLLDADWSGHHPDDPANRRTPVRLLAGPHHHAVLTTVANRPDGRLGSLIGDVLVTPDSARGWLDPDGRRIFPDTDVAQVGGLGHLAQLNDPRVYAHLRTWLAD